MTENAKIDPLIFEEVKAHLARIEKEYDVVILQAIESGSRAWGFPSPDSDYDVRFIYAHPKDWYLQLNEQRDVIELPINDELDIAGWDLRKALNLANKGNAVVQEWMISPIVYQQSSLYTSLYEHVSKAFNPVATYHHYRSMAKKAYQDIEQSEQKKLKRFFYFARATLSAQWVFERQTMPSIIFQELVESLINQQELANNIYSLVEQKERESEKSLLEVPLQIFSELESIYCSLPDKISTNSNKPQVVLNEDFRQILSNF